jgi:hypothetical protein
MMKIGIIDTGADAAHKRLKNHRLSGITVLKNQTGSVSFADRYADQKGHGTGVASIILQHVPEAELFIVKLEAAGGVITEKMVETGIRYLLEKTDVRMINISMGIKTNTPSSGLQQICTDAFSKGVVIVAAVHYLHNKLCYPAHFSTVIGVGQGVVDSKYKFRYLENKLADVLAKGGLQRVAYPGNQFRFSVGTSLATAHFTGILANAFNRDLWNDRESLQRWIKSNASADIISFTKHDMDISGLKKSGMSEITETEVVSALRPKHSGKTIAIFPFEEKEMKSILEFHHLLPYQLTLAIGYPRSLKIDNTVAMMEKLNIRHLFGQPEEDDLNSFDTIVIGYFLDKLLDQNSYFGYTLIRKCVLKQKNFIVWDKYVYDLIWSVIKETGADYQGEVFLTAFTAAHKEKLYSLMEYDRLTVPSICVVGTNSKQGKFTTQLVLRQILETNSYKVAHLSTEPQGIILGAEFAFPIGHQGTVETDIRDWNKSLRLLTQLMERKRQPDVIVTGSQGCIIPRHPMNDSNAAEMLSFVKAFYPDALVCAISPNDTIDFIMKTVEVIKAYVKCTVICYVLTPWEYHLKVNSLNQMHVYYKRLQDEEYLEKLNYYNERLPAPTFNIMDAKNHGRILELIQQTFSIN